MPAWAVAALAVGKGLDLAGICPIVKLIWTPSWAIFSTGWTLLILAGFFGVIDIVGLRRWSFPLIVVGMNSILMYVMESMLSGWFDTRLKIHFGQDVFARVSDVLRLGDVYVPIVEHAMVLLGHVARSASGSTDRRSLCGFMRSFATREKHTVGDRY